MHPVHSIGPCILTNGNLESIRPKHWLFHMLKGAVSYFDLHKFSMHGIILGTSAQLDAQITMRKASSE